MRPDGSQARWETDTVPLTPPLANTLELPVVPATPQTVPPATASPAAPARPSRPKDLPRRSRRGRWVFGLALLVLAAGTAVAIALAGGGRPTGRHAVSQAGSPLTIRTVSSVDPAGGSGWRRSGSDVASAVWRTQHYRSPEFGGLKSGLGLLIDLGSARRLTAVRTTAGVPGTTVELLAGDSAGPAPGSFRSVDRVGNATGATTLRAVGGGSHRYWLVWVPRLGQDGGGYSAELRGLTVRG
ncbi:MAG: hypothetical protein ABJC62_04850 [Frankiaceae bacterium]